MYILFFRLSLFLSRSFPGCLCLLPPSSLALSVSLIRSLSLFLFFSLSFSPCLPLYSISPLSCLLTWALPLLPSLSRARATSWGFPMYQNQPSEPPFHINITIYTWIYIHVHMLCVIFLVLILLINWNLGVSQGKKMGFPNVWKWKRDKSLLHKLGVSHTYEWVISRTHTRTRIHTFTM